MKQISIASIRTLAVAALASAADLEIHSFARLAELVLE